jgi:integral membrane protein
LTIKTPLLKSPFDKLRVTTILKRTVMLSLSKHTLKTNFPMKKTFTWFRKTAFAEGISFIVLLFVAMPLKYFAGMPMAVTIIGSAHGALFVAFMALAYMVKEQYNKPLSWGVKAFLASIIPFGTFYMEKQWKKEEAEGVEVD